MLDAVRQKFKVVDKEAEAFFTKGNKAAGTRARKAVQELKGLLTELRVTIQNIKKEVK